jgi:hypothetical protein
MMMMMVIITMKMIKISRKNKKYRKMKGRRE